MTQAFYIQQVPRNKFTIPYTFGFSICIALHSAVLASPKELNITIHQLCPNIGPESQGFSAVMDLCFYNLLSL